MVSRDNGLIARFVRFNLLQLDAWWFAHLFIEQEQDKEVKTNAENEIKIMCRDYETKVPFDTLKEPAVLRYTGSFYLDYMLKPTLYFMDKEGNKVWVLIAGFTSWFIYKSIEGLMNLREKASDLGTLEVLAKWPATPGLLAFATHLVLAEYAKKQLKGFKQTGKRPAYPVLYQFFAGKLFMMVRLCMSYSSGEMGNAINFFVWQELFLIAIHIICSSCILPFYDTDPSKPESMKQVFKFVIYMDAFKTLATFFYWLSYKPGFMANVFDRMPTVESQIYASLLLHGVLDVVQASATVFTMAIGQFMKERLALVDTGFEASLRRRASLERRLRAYEADKAALVQEGEAPVSVTGAEDAAPMWMGVFRDSGIRPTVDHDGRLIYENGYGKQLYYWKLAGTWVIGQPGSYASGRGKFYCRCTAESPTDTREWKLFTAGAWKPMPTLCIESNLPTEVFSIATEPGQVAFISIATDTACTTSGPRRQSGLEIVSAESLMRQKTTMVSDQVQEARTLLSRESKRSFVECLQHEARGREEVEVLEHVIRRLQYRMKQVGNADGEHRTLQTYRRIVVELSKVEGLAFDIVGLLSNAVEEIEDMKPLPPADVATSLFVKLQAICDSNLPGFDKSFYEYGNLWYTYKLTGNETNEAEVIEETLSNTESMQKILAFRSQAQEAAMEALSDLQVEFDKYPVCHWFVQILWESIRVRYNFTLFTYGWGHFSVRHKPGLAAMRWAALGEELVAAIDTRCLMESDVRSADLFGIEELQVEVLPVLTLELTHLKALMQRNILKSEDFKKTLLAGLVTVGITLGQYLVKYYHL